MEYMPILKSLILMARLRRNLVYVLSEKRPDIPLNNFTHH